MTQASAPGKIILFGEHAVVYNRPALAVPISQVCANVVINESLPAKSGVCSGVWIEAPDISINTDLSKLPPEHALGNMVRTIFNALAIKPLPELHIRITSSIPVASGLGSGAAVSVALIRAISSQLKLNLNDDQVNALCFETEKLLHGTPSGIDNTVITYKRPVYFVKGQPIETFQVKNPFTIVIADTGISAPTKESVGDVRKLWETDPMHWNEVLDQVGGIVRQARQAIESGGWQRLGELMDENHQLLQKLTVSSRELDHLVNTARAAGALGAKLSGGGRGGNMIALCEHQPAAAERVAAALRSAGATHTITTTIQ